MICTDKDASALSAGVCHVAELPAAILLPLALVFTYFFGRYLPPMTAFLSGRGLYTQANYVYDKSSIFDDTVLTWGSDYGLAICHGYLSYRLFKLPVSADKEKLRLYSGMLVASFAMSTFAGAIAHQFLPYRINTFIFRMVWRVCVGAVGAAGGLLGLCAGEIAKLPTAAPEKHRPRFIERMPVFPTFFWALWSFFFFFVIWSGAYSMKNPACDIFLTGVTQAPPTLYFVAVLLNRVDWTSTIGWNFPALLMCVGLMSNCILLPAYDVLNYINIRDGVRNIFLHSVLFLAWTSQGIALELFTRGAQALTKAS